MTPTDGSDELDGRLLQVIQHRVPLVRRCYEMIAAELGCGEQTVIDRVAALRRAGVLREIAGIFDLPALGYSQVLVAFRLTANLLDAAGLAVAEHPGVSHCYSRSTDVPEAPNLWFTLACSPQSTLGVGKTAELLARLSRAEAHLVLPALKRYKLHVRFPLPAGDSTAGEFAGPHRPEDHCGEAPRAPVAPSRDQTRAVRALQADLPAAADPFAAIAAPVGMDPDELLVYGADFLAAGWMRRYGAVVRHAAAGARANVLVAWRAGRGADAAGARASEIPTVSHCYLRATAAAWPYDLYTMVHGRNRQDCRITIDRIVATTGLRDRVELWTERQYKKQRVRLFGEDEAEWERARHSSS